MSWKSEVIADSTGEWVGNGLRFATKDEADAYVTDLAIRWTAVRQHRVVASDEPVNHHWEGGSLFHGEVVQ